MRTRVERVVDSGTDSTAVSTTGFDTVAACSAASLARSAGSINLFIVAIVDPEAFREDTTRRKAELQRQIDDTVRNMQDVADQKP